MLNQILSQYFLNPLGLLALTGVLVVVILYLTRPKPEKKIMPSMKFFQEKEKNSKLRKAFRNLKSNIILLLNILIVSVASMALAGFYLEGPGADNTVIVYDRSASMHEAHAEAVSTVLSKASTENTVIMAGENVEVFEEVSRQTAAEIVRENPPSYSSGSMDSAVQRARGYKGNLLILSDLDVSQSTLDRYRELGAERGVQQMEYSTENQLGFVDVNKESVEIRNYGSNRIATVLSVNSGTKDVELDPGETSKVELDLKQGKNRLKLPNDGFNLDNKAYIYVPGEEKIEVEYHGPENQYINTALEEIRTVEASNNGDIIILNEFNEELYSDDRPKVLMQGSADHWATVSNNEQVKLDPPYSLGFESKVYETSVNGTSWSSPEKALFNQDNSIYYNIEDSKINTEFVYPVLWKDMLHSLKEPVTFESSNKDVSTSKYDEPGFNGSKAVNYFNKDESNIEPNQIETGLTESTIKQNQSQIISLILLLILSVETLMILERGIYE